MSIFLTIIRSMRLSLLLVSLVAFTTFGQRVRHDEHHNHDPEGRGSHDHLSHIEAYRAEIPYFKNLPPPQFLSGIGSSPLKTVTASPEAQRWFSQGVALLHCFWDFEAYRAFKEAIRLDSNAVLPYWGLYSAIGAIEGNDFDRDKRLAIQKLKALKDKTNEHERLYAEAILARENDRAGKDFQLKMETILHRFPDDIDARLFLAMAVRRGHDLDLNPKEGSMYAEFLVKDVLRTHPDNAAAHHYWIHLKENCCPADALESAQALPRLAPNSGHMVHMPGHVYYKLGDYHKAHTAFIDAVKTDSTYMAVQGIPEVDNWNYIHNVNYLLSNCAENGHYKTALYYAEKLENMPATKERKQKYEGRFFYQGKIAPAKMELCFGYYDRAVRRLKAIDNRDTLYSARAIAYRDGLYHFASGLDALQRGKITEAVGHSDALDAGLWRAGHQKSEENQVGSRWLPALNVASIELQGRIKAARGDYKEAVALLETAQKKEEELGYSEPPTYARPVLISLGETHLAFKNYEKAEAAFQKLLQRHPNTSNGYWGLYKVYKQKGNEAKAKEYAAKLKAVIEGGEQNLFPL